MLTEKQKKERKIGASDMGVILGIDTRKTPLALYSEKVGDIEAADLSNVEAVQWGQILENTVAGEYARRHNVKLIEPDTFVNPKYPWLTCHADRLIEGQPKGLEVKTAGAYMAKEYGVEHTDEVPELHIIQCTTYAAVYGFKDWALCALIGGNRYKDYEIAYNSKLGNAILEASREFWKRVEDRNPPDAQTLDDLKLLWPVSNAGKVLEVNQEVHAVIESYRDIQAKIKLLEADAERFKFEIGSVLGDSEIAVYEGKKAVTWKSQNRTTIDIAKLREQYPEVARSCERISSIRVFR